MSNRTIAIILMVFSWSGLALSVMGGFVLFILYSLINVYLSAYIYHKQAK